jgi:hypothetical protein
MTRVLWLISEDKTDTEFFARILEKQGLDIRVEAVLLPDGHRGLNFMPRELPKLIAATNKRKQPEDFLVLWA